MEDRAFLSKNRHAQPLSQKMASHQEELEDLEQQVMDLEEDLPSSTKKRKTTSGNSHRKTVTNLKEQLDALKKKNQALVDEVSESVFLMNAANFQRIYGTEGLETLPEFHTVPFPFSTRMDAVIVEKKKTHSILVDSETMLKAVFVPNRKEGL